MRVRANDVRAQGDVVMKALWNGAANFSGTSMVRISGQTMAGMSVASRVDLVFGPDGCYLSKLRSSNGLIINRSRMMSRRGPSSAPYASRVGRVP